MLEYAAEINSEDASIHHQLARLQSESGESQQAIERLRYAVTKNPQDTEAFVELSRILMQQNRYPEANQTLKAALQLDPNHIEALMLSGSWEERHNQTSLAMETYHRVLGIEHEASFDGALDDVEKLPLGDDDASPGSAAQGMAAEQACGNRCGVELRRIAVAYEAFGKTHGLERFGRSFLAHGILLVSGR